MSSGVYGRERTASLTWKGGLEFDAARYDRCNRFTKLLRIVLDDGNFIRKNLPMGILSSLLSMMIFGGGMHLERLTHKRDGIIVQMDFCFGFSDHAPYNTR